MEAKPLSRQRHICTISKFPPLQSTSLLSIKFWRHTTRSYSLHHKNTTVDSISTRNLFACSLFFRKISTPFVRDLSEFTSFSFKPNKQNVRRAQKQLPLWHWSLRYLGFQWLQMREGNDIQALCWNTTPRVSQCWGNHTFKVQVECAAALYNVSARPIMKTIEFSFLRISISALNLGASSKWYSRACHSTNKSVGLSNSSTCLVMGPAKTQLDLAFSLTHAAWLWNQLPRHDSGLSPYWHIFRVNSSCSSSTKLLCLGCPDY